MIATSLGEKKPEMLTSEAEKDHAFFGGKNSPRFFDHSNLQ